MKQALKAGALVGGLLGAVVAHADTATKAELADFLGTTVEAIEAINPRFGVEGEEVTRGSAIRRSFQVNAGDTLSFDWLFGTDEGPLNAANDIVDFAFFAVNGLLDRLASSADPLAPSGATLFTEYRVPDVLGSTPGFETFTVNFAESGTITLAFGVVDTTDIIVESGLILDNIQLNGALIDNGGFESDPLLDGWEVIGDATAWTDLPVAPEGNTAVVLMAGTGPVPVPLPAGVWLMGSALATLGWRRLRRG
jgi:hypothetical protein